MSLKGMILPIRRFSAAGGPAAELPTLLILLLAVVSGLIVANIYYAQPLVGPISTSLGLSSSVAGLIVTATQIGYGLGLLFVVPLGDLLENRRLVVASLCLATLALFGAGLSHHAAPFLLCALLIGIGSVAVQVLVPYAAHLTPEATRGRTVGNVMSGLMLGIMLARPVASFVTHASSWHTVFYAAATMMVGVILVLSLAMPRRKPQPGLSYVGLLRSMAHLAWHTPVLQRRASYHAFLFAAFSLFWTAVPLLLADKFHLSQNGIALFALAGIAGAIAAPVAGRAADRGWTKPATAASMLVVVLAFLLARVGQSPGQAHLAILVTAAIMIDFGVTGHLVLAQRALFSLGAEFRSRLNGLFMATFFLGGAGGSALAGWSYARGGWPLTLSFGLVLPAIALVCSLSELRGETATQSKSNQPPHPKPLSLP